MEQIVTTVNVREPRGELKAQAGIECKLPVPSSGVYRVLSAVARPVETVGEGAEGEIRYRGKVLFSVTFSDGEGRVQKTECGVEFSGAEPCALANRETGVETQSAVGGVRFRIAGDSLYLTGTVRLTFRLAQTVQHAVLADLPSAFIQKEERKIPWKIKEISGEMELEEEWSEPTAVADILTFTAQAYVRNAQAGVGVVAAEGGTVFHILMKTGEGGVCSVQKSFPFRVETEEGDAFPACSVRLHANVENVRFSVVTNPDRGEGKITVTYTLRFSGALYGEGKITCLTDCFSETEHLNLAVEKTCFETLSLLKNETARVTARAPLPVAVLESSRALAVLPYGVDSVALTAISGGVQAEGVLSLTVFYAEEGALKGADADIPFSLHIKCDLPQDSQPEVHFTVESVQADFTGEKELSVTATLALAFAATQTESLSYVKEVLVGESKEKSDSALTLYFAKPGESAWELAKRLSVSPETLSLCNPDLTYPLSGKERIVIYRQK